MNRRDVLNAGLGLFCVGGLSGCTGPRSPDSNGGTQSRSSGTERVTSETLAGSSTPADTPVPFPETCESFPDIDGLPTPPSELSEDAVETFVRDFESVYAVTTTEEYGDVDELEIRSVEAVGDRFVVTLSFDAVPATPTPDAAGATATPHPPDAYTHRAVYRVEDDRMVRELRSHIDHSLLSRVCWTLVRE